MFLKMEYEQMESLQSEFNRKTAVIQELIRNFNGNAKTNLGMSALVGDTQVQWEINQGEWTSAADHMTLVLNQINNAIDAIQANIIQTDAFGAKSMGAVGLG